MYRNQKFRHLEKSGGKIKLKCGTGLEFIDKEPRHKIQLMALCAPPVHLVNGLDTYNLFHSGPNILHSHQQCTEVQFLCFPINTCRILNLINLFILQYTYQCICVVFICISLIINDIEHLSIHLFASGMSLFGEASV